MQYSKTQHPRWTWYPVIFLLLLCLTRGLWVTRGLSAPAIMDTFRDAGFVQGIVDGNWFGDPAIDGAWRYYPPLIHAIFAAVAASTGITPLQLLMIAAPWVNLIVPLSFFLMSRNVLGAPAAVCGTAWFVLFNGLVLPPWISAAYHPWSSIPILALGGFFLSLWLIHARIRSEKYTDVWLIGSAIGLTFLAHTVPAVILAAVLPLIAISARGFTLKTLGWIAAVGMVGALWSLPLMLPLLVSYRLHVLNVHPGAFVDPLFAARPTRGMLLTLLPGLIAMPVIGLLRTERLSREAMAIFAVWILLPALFLTRHYACGPDSHATACTVFVLAVHHWFIYLQAALTCLAGFAAWLCIDRASRIGRIPNALTATGWVAAAVLGTVVFCLRPSDGYMRQRSIALAEFFDWDAYKWVLQHTTPHDLFVTELKEDSLNAASVAVMTAGRPSVALPSTYSNPYVEWESRNVRSSRYLIAARVGGQAVDSPFCSLLGEASHNANAYIILPNSQSVGTEELRPASMGLTNTIYRATPHCTMTVPSHMDASLAAPDSHTYGSFATLQDSPLGAGLTSRQHSGLSLR